MTDLTSMTIAEARAGLASKSFTALELTDAHLKAMEAARSLNAFVLETPDQARAMQNDERRRTDAATPPDPRIDDFLKALYEKEQSTEKPWRTFAMPTGKPARRARRL